ncbi:predicted protein [Streptomyces sp. C]|nr:predicted protein [Streptomyces sp. C]
MASGPPRPGLDPEGAGLGPASRALARPLPATAVRGPGGARAGFRPALGAAVGMAALPVAVALQPGDGHGRAGP